MKTIRCVLLLSLVWALSLGALSAADNPSDVARAFFEKVWSQGDMETAHRIINSGFQFHNPMIRIQGPTGPELVTGRVEMMREAFPDLKFEVNDVFAEGPKVCVRWTASGTHEGPLGGNEATGKSISYQGMTVFEVHSGQIYEEWTIEDFRSALRQLGIQSLRISRSN